MLRGAQPSATTLLSSLNKGAAAYRLNLGLNGLLPVEQVMTSPPTTSLSAANTPTLSRAWPASVNTSALDGSAAGQYFSATNTTVNTGAYGIISYFNQGLLGPRNYSVYHTGQNLEIGLNGNNTGAFGGAMNARVKVNGQYVTLSCQTVANDSNTYWLKLAFASRATRRIDITGITGVFAGFQTDGIDTIEAAPLRGLNLAISGDSFLGGAVGDGGAGHASPINSGGFGGAQCYGQIAGEALGIDRLLLDGIGGSGWVVGTTLATRFATNVLPFNPDVYAICLGRNDNATASATVGAAVLSTLQTIRAALPNTTLVVFSPLWPSGAFTWPSGLLPVRDAIKTSALQVTPYYCEALTRSLPSWINLAPITLVNSVTAGATTFKIPATGGAPNTSLPVPIIVKIDSEIIEVQSYSGNTYTIDGTFASNHSSGATVTVLGTSVFSGHGNLLVTTGYGNADESQQGDNTHPSSTGSLIMGLFVAKAIKNILSLTQDSYNQIN